MILLSNKKSIVRVDNSERGGSLRLRSGQAAAALLIALFFILYSPFFLSAPKAQAAARLQMPPNYLKSNSGLVGYWTFDGKDTNWGTNTTNDVSGQGNTGTMTNMSRSTSPTEGKVGQALDFDGVNEVINIGDPINGSLDFGTGDFSISLWEKTSDPTSNFEMLFSKHSIPGSPMTGGLGYELATHATATGNVRFYLSDGTIFLACDGVTGTDIRDGSWHHIAIAVTRNNTATIYVDSSAAAPCNISTLSGSVSNASNFRIAGPSNGDPTLHFPGSIDEVRVYNTALSATDVAALYNLSR